ncbi:MAG: hypothetical protein HYT79_00470 [Elusimicrobia bacterium]|nr:hypothetical protein [Elusimicrobiota bacterium]
MRRIPAVLFFSFALETGLAWHWDSPAGRLRETLFADSGEADQEETAEPPYQRIRRNNSGFNLEFGFVSFDREPHSVRFQMDQRIVNQAITEFGYTDAGLEAVDTWLEETQQQTNRDLKRDWVSGSVSAKNQAELDRKVAAVRAHNTNLETAQRRKIKDLQTEYEERRVAYFQRQGFKLLPGNTVTVDIPALVRNNVRRLMPVAAQFDLIREKNNYGSEDLIGAVTAMIQTALEYKIPPAMEGSLHTGGVLTPIKALVSGWGDCDTKTALLASILLNWDAAKIVGVGLPGHYVMGFEGVPDRGDAYIEYRGTTYVLIEPAGPAWAHPGEVSEQTMTKLQLAQGVSIEPFSAP